MFLLQFCSLCSQIVVLLVLFFCSSFVVCASRLRSCFCYFSCSSFVVCASKLCSFLCYFFCFSFVVCGSRLCSWLCCFFCSSFVVCASKFCSVVYSTRVAWRAKAGLWVFLLAQLWSPGPAWQTTAWAACCSCPASRFLAGANPHSSAAGPWPKSASVARPLTVIDSVDLLIVLSQLNHDPRLHRLIDS